MTAVETAYVYILVRADLPHAQQCVQSVHAAIEGHAMYASEEEHPHLVVCSVANETELLAARAELKAKGVLHVAYFEPDMARQITAIATMPLRGKERQPLRKFALLR